MKEKIEAKLQELVGLPISGTTRTMNMECLKFGDKKKEFDGEWMNIGKFGIHIQCDWRIVSDKEIIIGSRDLYHPKEGQSEESFDYEEGNLRDEKLNKFISSTDLKVTSVDADVYGGFELKFGDQYVLQVIPLSSIEDEYQEFWRLLDNRSEKSNHFVVRKGITEE